MTLPFVIAHTGHWAVDVATYLVPLVVVVTLLKLSDRRQRRRDQAAGRGQEEPG